LLIVTDLSLVKSWK